MVRIRADERHLARESDIKTLNVSSIPLPGAPGGADLVFQMIICVAVAMPADKRCGLSIRIPFHHGLVIHERQLDLSPDLHIPSRPTESYSHG